MFHLCERVCVCERVCTLLLVCLLFLCVHIVISNVVERKSPSSLYIFASREKTRNILDEKQIVKRDYTQYETFIIHVLRTNVYACECAVCGGRDNIERHIRQPKTHTENIHIFAVMQYFGLFPAKKSFFLLFSHSLLLYVYVWWLSACLPARLQAKILLPAQWIFIYQTHRAK